MRHRTDDSSLVLLHDSNATDSVQGRPAASPTPTTQPALIYQVVLFASPQFYSFPWKPLLNRLVGDTYPVAVAHFAPHHATRANLALHFVCLLVQLSGNFCFLTLLDMTVTGSRARPFSLATALLWSVYLVLGATTAPIWCNVAAVASIVAAYAAAPVLLQQPTALTLVPLVLYVLVALVSGVSVPGYARLGAAAQVTIFLGLLHVGWMYLETSPPAPSDVGVPYTLGFCTVLVLLAALPRPTLPTVLFGALVGRSLGIWTRQPLLTLYCYGYFGSLLQVLAHGLAKEQATLLALEDEGSLKKVRYEYAHVTYFPTLVFEGMYCAAYRPCDKKDA
ncbi:hypothetical protein SPRG_08092 [Saprolegnia parasitica CBS 223.65]|uniref:Uncharacterized protein n=1 Tax=Saprolegnia parasitica (strain CBS 223.65) TaxID=695850 RepID=A0A067CJ20_SAPPC|nr:hypothetical protein SPRG_08092 [Saprolegnia parasitica CBS 223.65]KDO26802.1 hypothetical protein SPRG_08092 [Saprolegnia parasitica CBS 223.65]|eukprot:XP_012202450.1 hypothetical protein SPRG_08092 [Saprolegnia parasitica CBS 223.65]